MKLSDLVIVLLSVGSGLANPELAVCARWVDPKNAPIRGVINLIFGNADFTKSQKENQTDKIEIVDSVPEKDIQMVQDYFAITTSSMKDNLSNNSHFAGGLFHEGEVVKDFSKGCQLRDFPKTTLTEFDCSCISMKKLEAYTTPEKLTGKTRLELYNEDKHKDWVSKDIPSVLVIANDSKKQEVVNMNKDNFTLNSIDLRKLDIQSLSSEQVKAIDIEIFESFNDDQIKLFIDNHFNELTSDQLGILSDQELNGLNEEKKELFKATTKLNLPDEITSELLKSQGNQNKNWTKEEVSVLTQDQIKLFTVDQVKEFTSKDPMWLNPKQINWLDNRQIRGLAPGAIPSLTPEKIKSLKIVDLRNMSGDQLLTLTVDQIDVLVRNTAAKVFNIVRQAGKHYNEEQLSALTKALDRVGGTRRKLTDLNKVKNNSFISGVGKIDKNTSNLLKQIKIPVLTGDNQNFAQPLLSKSDKGLAVGDAWQQWNDYKTGLLI